ncbi:MAG: tetratricopeptide repeat protein, partial [Phycisphaerae bacterium]|nr:tetratricopeptide repeat protein [Phycisphaerae bacterium]
MNVSGRGLLAALLAAGWAAMVAVSASAQPINPLTPAASPTPAAKATPAPTPAADRPVPSPTEPPPLPAGNPSPADKDFHMANYFFGQKKWIEAADEYQNFVKNYPGDKRAADALFGRGQALFQLGRFKFAAEAFQTLLDGYPKFEKRPLAQFQLAQSLLNAKDTDKAIAAFADVTQKNPGHYLAEWADAMRGGCMVTQKQYAKAEPLLLALVDRYVRGKDAAARLVERKKELAAVNTQ